MYQSNFEFVIPYDIVNSVDEFFANFNAAYNIGFLQNEEEASEILSIFSELTRNLNTPLYLLEISRRILVDGSDAYGNLLAITAFFNKLFEGQKQIKDTCESDPEYKNCIVSSILYLLPFAALYFQETNDLKCFSHLFSSLLEVIITFSEESTIIFNQYIDNLINEENPYQNLIAIQFASKFEISEPVANKLIIYITALLNDLPNCDLNNYIENITYQNLFFNLHTFLSNILKYHNLDVNIYFRSIYNFFNRFINQFRQSHTFLTEPEVELFKTILNFNSYFISELEKKTSLADAEINNRIINALFPIIYKKIYYLNRASTFALSTPVSEFLLSNIIYLTPDLLNQSPEYFIELIFQLSISPSHSRDIFESEESFFVDYYDIPIGDSTIFFSNRQNIPHIIHDFAKLTNNYSIIITIAEKLSSFEIGNVREFHFFLLSMIILVTEKLKCDDETVLTSLYELLVGYLEMGTELITENHFRNAENSMFNFTYFLLISSSFYLIKMNEGDQMNDTIIELYNEQLGNLMQIVSTYDEEHPDDDFYRTYFTFFCCITNKLIDIDSLGIPLESTIQFTEEYLNFCITNDSIYLMERFAEIAADSELMVKIFNQYLAECTEILDKYKKYFAYLKSIDDDDEEEEEVNDDDDEEKPDSQKLLLRFEENVSRMSNIIKRADLSLFDVSEVIHFGKKLAKIDTSNETFLKETVTYFTALFSVVGDISELFDVYYNFVLSGEHGSTCEYSIPIIRAISSRYDSVDQELYEKICVYLRKFIENWVTVDEGRQLITTEDFIQISTLIARLLEIGATDQLQIPPEDLEFFLSLAFDTVPTEEDCIDDGDGNADYNKEDHELAAYILKLASYLSMDEIDQDELMMFLVNLVEGKLIICQEMRYLIIFLIDNAIENKEDEQIAHLRQACLVNEIEKDGIAKHSYDKNYDLFVGDEKHPIFNFYPMEGFVFDE